MKSRTRLLPSKLISDNGYIATDNEIIAEEFNNCFFNIEKTVTDAIVHSLAYDLNLTAFNKNNNSLFLKPRCSQEIFNVIKKLNRLKDVETLYIEYANPVISKFKKRNV